MKRQLIRVGKPLRFLIIFALIIGGTLALVAYGQGYIFNFRTGEITGGGLVLLDSQPEDALIWADGVEEGTTPARLRLTAGEHTVDMYRDGYRSWKKEFSVPEGQVIDAEYPILIPDEVETLPVNDISAPQRLIAAPNHRQLAVIHGDPARNISRLRADSTEVDSWYELPESMSGYTVNSAQWSPEGNQLLLETANSNDETRYLLLETGSSSARDISGTYDLALDRLSFSGNENVLYGLSNGRLLELELQTGGSDLVARGVIDWDVGAGNLYVLREPTSGQPELMVLRGGNLERLHTLGRNGSYRIKAASYEEQRNVIVHDRVRQQISIIDTDNDEGASYTLPPKTAASISFSPNQRFLLMRNGSFFHTYDFDNNQQYDFQLSQLPEGDINWYGSHHLLFVLDGSTVIAEFDGANRELLSATVNGVIAGMPNEGAVYSIGRNAVTGQLLLQRSLLD